MTNGRVVIESPSCCIIKAKASTSPSLDILTLHHIIHSHNGPCIFSPSLPQASDQLPYNCISLSSQPQHIHRTTPLDPNHTAVTPISRYFFLSTLVMAFVSLPYCFPAPLSMWLELAQRVRVLDLSHTVA